MVACSVQAGDERGCGPTAPKAGCIRPGEWFISQGRGARCRHAKCQSSTSCANIVRFAVFPGKDIHGGFETDGENTLNVIPPRERKPRQNSE